MELKLSVLKETSKESLEIGDSVKVLINNEEKMWVEITEISGGQFKGHIDENPCKLEGVQFKDPISFKRENIYQVLKK